MELRNKRKFVHLPAHEASNANTLLVVGSGLLVDSIAKAAFVVGKKTHAQ
jgi:hypothetical protein